MEAVKKLGEPYHFVLFGLCLAYDAPLWPFRSADAADALLGVLVVVQTQPESHHEHRSGLQLE